MDSFQIKIKDLKPRKRNRRLRLWEALACLGLEIYRLDETRGGYKITTDSRTMEKLITQENKNSLYTHGFTPLTPLDYDSRRTLLARYVHVHIANASREHIIASIEENNIGIDVEDIVHIPGSPKLLKIKFKNVEAAKDAKEYGINIMSQKIRPEYLEEEIYINIKPCYTCFQYSHSTTDCPTPQLVVCSECSMQGHLFQDCPNNHKKCLNCNKEHRTLAASCPIRKKIIKERTTEQINKKKTKTTQKDSGNKPSHKNMEPTSLPTNALAVIYTAIIYAACEELSSPGAFQNKMDEIYQANGLPTVRVPAPRDPKSLLRAIQRAHSTDPGRTSQEEPQADYQTNTIEDLRNLSDEGPSLLHQSDLDSLGHSAEELCSTLSQAAPNLSAITQKKRPRKRRHKKENKHKDSRTSGSTPLPDGQCGAETQERVECSSESSSDIEELKHEPSRMTSTPTGGHRKEVEFNNSNEEGTSCNEEPTQFEHLKCFWSRKMERPPGMPLPPLNSCYTPDHWGIKIIGKTIYKPQEGVTRENQTKLWNFGALALLMDETTVSKSTFQDIIMYLFTDAIIFDKITWLDSATYDTLLRQKWTAYCNP